MTKLHILLNFMVVSQLFAGVATSIQAIPRPVPLSQFRFNSASVLPVTYFIKNGKPVKYVILSREAHGKDKGTYDDFGGKRDKYETHPVATAAREFFEESIAQNTFGINLSTLKARIDLSSKTNSTDIILATDINVTYLTTFTANEIDKFRKNFHKALGQTRRRECKEKDRIAAVRWDLLESAIKNSKCNTNVTVKARLTNPHTGKDEKNQTTITLRPFLVKKLRPYIENKPYYVGKSRKIRFY